MFPTRGSREPTPTPVQVKMQRSGGSDAPCAARTTAGPLLTKPNTLTAEPKARRRRRSPARLHKCPQQFDP